MNIPTLVSPARVLQREKVSILVHSRIFNDLPICESEVSEVSKHQEDVKVRKKKHEW